VDGLKFDIDLTNVRCISALNQGRDWNISSPGNAVAAHSRLRLSSLFAGPVKIAPESAASLPYWP
jgi:hypothetical protein